MKKFLFLTVFVCLFATNALAFDTALGNKALGVGSQGGPGFVLVSEVHYYYGVSQDANGNSVKGPDGDISTSLFVNAYVLEWTTPVEIFGAKYAMDAVFSFIGINVDSGDYALANPNGLVDVYFEPVILAWSTKQLDSKFILGVNVPIGSESISFDHFTFIFSGAFSYYFNESRTIQLSLMPIVEYHLTDQSTGKTQGIEAALKWGVGYTMGMHTFGIVGYSMMQLTDDEQGTTRSPSIAAAPTDPAGTVGGLISPAITKAGDEYVHAIGVQYNKFVPSLHSVISVLVHQEIAAAGRDKGTRVHLALVKIF